MKAEQQHYKPNLSDEPGINFDEVHHHHVLSRGQLERLLNVGSLALGIVPTTDSAITATAGNFPAVPALKIMGIAEICTVLRA